MLERGAGLLGYQWLQLIDLQTLCAGLVIPWITEMLCFELFAPRCMVRCCMWRTLIVMLMGFAERAGVKDNTAALV